MRRLWTAADDRRLTRMVGAKRKHADIAAALGRSLSAVHGRVTKLGLNTKHQGHPGLDALIRRSQESGWCDTEICDEWNRRHPNHTVSRGWISERRRKMQLPNNRTHDRFRRRVAAKTREQCAKAGVKSLAEVRSLAFQAFAVRMGWPADLRPRAVQILTLLYQRGPMTRRQIADAIGMTWKGSRKSLASNDPEGSYLAHLQARGLVARAGRMVKGKGRGGSVNLYLIPPHITRNLSHDHEKEQQSRPARHGRRDRPRGANVSGGAA